MARIAYTKDHEWVRLEADGTATVGITTYAQEQLGDVVFVEVPEPGRTLSQGDQAAVVEAVKAASEVYAPVAGKVTEGNAALAEKPMLVNEDAMGAGWFFRMSLADPAQLDRLMDEAAYGEFVKGLH